MIPDYQSLMLPLLKLVSDRQEYKFRDIVDRLAAQFNLSADERKELLTSGQQPIFDNRVGWAKTYMKKAGLLDTPKRAAVVITQRGLDVLKQDPEGINARFLRQFPEFVEFQTIKRDTSEEEQTSDEIETRTPEETLETAYRKIRKSLALEILSKVVDLIVIILVRIDITTTHRKGRGTTHPIFLKKTVAVTFKNTFLEIKTVLSDR